MGLTFEKFMVRLLSSRARIKPRIEMSRAVVFKCQGMVRI